MTCVFGFSFPCTCRPARQMCYMLVSGYMVCSKYKCVLRAAVGQPDAPLDTSAPPYPILSFVAVSNDTVKPGGVLRAPAGLPLSARFGQVQIRGFPSLPGHPAVHPRKSLCRVA